MILFQTLKGIRHGGCDDVLSVKSASTYDLTERLRFDVLCACDETSDIHQCTGIVVIPTRIPKTPRNSSGCIHSTVDAQASQPCCTVVAEYIDVGAAFQVVSFAATQPPDELSFVSREGMSETSLDSPFYASSMASARFERTRFSKLIPRSTCQSQTRMSNDHVQSP